MGFKSFTFHYASTISPTDIGHYPISISFTFHYASTISVYGLKLDAHLRPLHSTMLLLYPNVFPAITMFSHFTFHYASTISELRSQNPWLHRLYIPLCFYYIKTRLQQLQCLQYLYIPLCFYYIKIDGGDDVYYFDFTFHYASTISAPAVCAVRFRTTFTFHYASTISAANWNQLKGSNTFTFHYASTISLGINRG